MRQVGEWERGKGRGNNENGCEEGCGTRDVGLQRSYGLAVVVVWMLDLSWAERVIVDGSSNTTWANGLAKLRTHEIQ